MTIISDDDNSMRLGKNEFRSMNNRFRRFVQKYIEFKNFIKMLKAQRISLDGKRILDAGCGSGYSSFLISKEFNPSTLQAFDYMPEQIEIAKSKFSEFNFEMGDMRSIKFEDKSFDAVFVFAVIHHIPQWQKALSELSRVLVSGGFLLIEEPKERFTFKELETEMNKAGFELIDKKRFYFGVFRSYLAKKR